MTHPPLADQTDRERFANELERNFSVIAPAGVGKTTAIVARVAALAKADILASDPVLPRLAVVTYTRKAAEEMQARARARLLADGAHPEQLGRFSQAFFGTIHSLCLLVLKSYGHLVGLPSNLEQTTALEPLWRQYLRSTDDLLHHLPPHARTPFLRHGSLSAALELVLKLPADLPPLPPLPTAPLPDIRPILDAPPNKNKRSQQNIEAGQAFARNWLHALHNESGHLPLPRQTTGGKDFVAAYAEVFRPLCDWLGEATLTLAKAVAENFRNYRKAQGKLSFDDMVSWAAAVLDHPEAGKLLRAQRWCVILDEAQDTDPMQFRVLLSLAGGQPPKIDSPKNTAATKENAAATKEDVAATKEDACDHAPTADAPARHPLLTPQALPPQGRFCMVGDPQQSIYSGRADLLTYRGIHQALVDHKRGEALRFTVTMRCDRTIVAVANRIFPSLLQDAGRNAAGNAAPGNANDTAPHPNNATLPAAANNAATDTDAALHTTNALGTPRQVPYVPLQPRPDAGAGSVSRLLLTEPENLPDELAQEETDSEAADDKSAARPKKSDSDRLAAIAFANAIASRQPQDFGVQDWSEIGILCVRNEPLGRITRALQNAGLPVQNHSQLDSRGQSPAYAWLSGLARIVAEPENAFETIGVLREVFGISDGALYAYMLAAGGAPSNAGGDKGANHHHPLCLSAGALALSGSQEDAAIKAVRDALNLLREIYHSIRHLPLQEAARKLSAQLDMPARLASLPDGKTQAHLAELETLLLQAGALQEQGYDWSQWADALEENFEARLDSAEPQQGHIQLLSCHKSKGLQWPVVILASLFRPVGYASDNFPKLLLLDRNALPRVAFTHGHGHTAIEQLLKLKDFQELQRLAYVACTRARRQMIFADDSVFYEKPSGSFADALGFVETNGSNADTWDSLPLWQPLTVDAQPPELPAAAPKPTDSSVNQSPKTGQLDLPLEPESAALIATGTPLPLSDAALARPQWNLSFTGDSTPEPASDSAATPATDGTAEPTVGSGTFAPATGSPFAAYIKRVLPSSLARHRPHRTAPQATATPAAPADSDTPTGSDGSLPSTSLPADADALPRGHARNEPDGSRALPVFAELEESAAAISGADYGNWWHKAMELAPWGKPETAWQQHTQAMLATCPDPQRGAVEWQKFTASELYQRLNRPQMIVRCELPLLWPDSQAGIAYDGFIDLVARDTESKQWLLIDWKTDRLHTFSDPDAELLRCYGGQLEAYRRALYALFNAPIQAHLYNTPNGTCVPPLAKG